MITPHATVVLRGLLTPIAHTVVAAFSFPAGDHREQVKARRAAEQAAGGWNDPTLTCLISEAGQDARGGDKDGPWE